MSGPKNTARANHPLLTLVPHLRRALFPILFMLTCVVSQVVAQGNGGQVPIPRDHLRKDVPAKPTRKVSDWDAPGFMHVQDPLPPFPTDAILPSDPVGFLPGSGSVTSSGEASYTLPLEVPPSRGDVAPHLALSYGSRRGDGQLGVGWSLTGLSEIRRCAKSISTEGFTDGIAYKPYDGLCLDGQRLVRLGTIGSDLLEHEVEYRTEHDTFARIQTTGRNLSDQANDPKGFRVYKRDGLILDYNPQQMDQWALYDHSNDARPFARVTYSWVLSDVTDRSGNTAHYEYDVDRSGLDGLEVRIASIAYAGSNVTGDLPLRKVLFHYEPRPDLSTYWEAGGRTKMTQRLSKIEMVAPNPTLSQVVWSYTLSYQMSRDTQRSLLESVHRCDAEGVCTWGKVFSWTEGFSQPNVYDLPRESVYPNLYDQGFLVFDADGDGTQDLLYRTKRGLFLRTGEHGAPLVHLHDVTSSLEQRSSFVLRLSRTADVFGDGRKALYAAEGRSVDGCFWFGYQLYRWDPVQEQFLEVGPFNKMFSNELSVGCEFAFFAEGQEFPEVTFVDINGDGLPDLVQPKPEGDTLGTWQVYLNLGGGAFGPPKDSGVYARFQPIRAVELDGDGRGEVLVPDSWTGKQTNFLALSLSPEGTLTSRSASSLPWGTTMDPFTDEDLNLVLADINGDGLTDAIYPPSHEGSASTTQIRWNTGNGYLAARPLSLELLLADVHRATRAADVNGDGRDDLIYLGPTIQMYLSLGGGLAYPIDTRIDPGRPTERQGHRPVWTTVELGDFTGDGLLDVVTVADDHLRVTELPFRENHDLLSGVRDEALAFTRDHFNYARAWYGGTGCVFPAKCIHHGFPVVSSFATTAGIAADGQARYHSWDYSYEDPRVDMQGRGFLGFGVVRAFDHTLQSETTRTFDHHTRSTFVNDHGVSVALYPHAGLPEKEVHVQPIFPLAPGVTMEGPARVFEEEARVTEVSRTYTLVPNGNTYSVNPSTWVTHESEQHVIVERTTIRRSTSVPPTPMRTRSGTLEFDGYGNVTLERTHEGGRSQTRTNTYDNRTGDWLLGLLRASKVISSSLVNAEGCEANSGPSSRETAYTYDAQGRLLTTTVEPNANDPSVTSTTTIERDNPLGLVTAVTRSATSVASRKVMIAHDPEGLFVVQTINDLGHTQTELHYPSNGAVVLSRDPNGVDTLARYDGFGRPKAIVLPDGTTTRIGYSAFELTPGQPVGITTAIDYGDGHRAQRSSDERGRVVSTSTLGFGGTWLVDRTVYNAAGPTERVYRRGAGTPSVSFTEHTYDSLGRPVRSVGPDGATTEFDQEMFLTTVTDPRGNTSWTQRDRLDRIVGSVNVAGGHPIETRYCYNNFNQVSAIRDPDGNWTERSYDILGRAVAEFSPDSGKYAYTYNGLGDRLQSVDALGTTTAHYDVLGRVDQVNDVDGTTTYAWDQAAHGLGQLAYSISPDGILHEVEYDAIGRVASTSWTVGDEKFAVRTGYDPTGRIDHITYPEVPGRATFTAQYSYTPAGYIERVQEVSNPAAPRTLWTVKARNADLAIIKRTFGSGNEIGSARGYDPATGRLQTIDVSSSFRRMPFSLGYDYDAAGNVLTRTEDGARNETYDYDELNRLHRWTLSGPGATRTSVYSYDDIGNITSVDVNGAVETAIYGQGAFAHALHSNSIVGSFGYDVRGRQVNGAGRALTYTNFDLPKTVTTARGATSFDYDAARRRIRKTDPAGTTITLGKLYERRRQGTTTQHVFYVAGESGPAAQVVYDETTQVDRTLFLETDALGSVNLVFDEHGAPVERNSTDPWGQRTKADGSRLETTPGKPVALGFTGQRTDDETGLIEMGARVYDPAQRRFLTPDTVVTNPLYGQAFNPWTYAYNNPLRFTDPSGYGPNDEDVGPPAYRGVVLPPGFPPEPSTNTPGNARAPDVTGPGGDDPRVVNDFSNPQEGIHGEYSNWEAWVQDLNAMTPASFDGPGVVTMGGTPDIAGNKFNPYSDEGRIGLALFGAERPLNLGEIPEQAKGPIRAAFRFVPIVNSLMVLSDPNASLAEKLWAVGSDAAMFVPVLGIAGKAASGGVRLGRAWVAAAEAAEAAVTMDTAAIRFTQSSVNQILRTGESINDVIAALRGPGGEALAKGFEPIRIFERNGAMFTLDNRRLLIFWQAGREIPYVWATSEEVASQAWKFTATAEQQGGWFIRVKGW